MITEPTRRHRLRVQGVVQGVGFRPFAYRLATELGLDGAVSNDADGVWCVIEGPASMVAEYEARLAREAPALASITSLTIEDLAPTGAKGFKIVETEQDPRAGTGLPRGGSEMIPPDVAPCTSCLADLGNPDDRRFGYAFTCCTDCGPRFTVVRGLPYDRARTALADFALCDACATEYETPDDRRFHAQATCCPACGPTLSIVAAGLAPVHGDLSALDPFSAAVSSLIAGGCVALKGLGGYQLLCRADDPVAVRRLREGKHRDEKPFALLVASLDQACRLVVLDDVGERALAGPEAPILLAPARVGPPVSDEVAPGTGLLGVMLPASPLHAMLAGAVGVPLVCTSGNLSQAPIIIDDDEALVALAPIADVVLAHDREIIRRADDSVGQVVGGRFQLLRRARGFAPRAITLPTDGPVILGVGAELKNTICLAHRRRAAVSVHLGDLENPDALRAFETTIADQLTLADVAPELIVHDLHPEYLSSKFADAQDLAPTLGVQHHHAHLASCLVDNGYQGPAVGVIFDGLGWGTDGTAWGGEFLVGDASRYDRSAHLGTVALPGGSMAIRHPWRMAVAHLVCAFGNELPTLALLDRHRDDVSSIVAMCGAPRTVRTSSIGRLFDAVAALCDVRDTVSYEGQAAIGLEQLATVNEAPYPWDLSDELGAIDPAPIVRAVVADLGAGIAPAVVAGRFHASVAALIVAVCRRIRANTELSTVALSGGVFQNRLLVELVIPELESDRFTVLRHAQVPPNDGGISLGQIAIGRARIVGGNAPGPGD